MSDQPLVRIYDKPLIKAVVIDSKATHDSNLLLGHCAYRDHANFFAHTQQEGMDNIKVGDQSVRVNKPIESWYYCPVCRIKWMGDDVFSIPDERILNQPIREYLKDKTKQLEKYDDFSGKQIKIDNFFIEEVKE